MAKLKPYLDADQTRQLMVENIHLLLEEGKLPTPLEQKCCALMSFYLNPPPAGYQYHWNHLWVLGPGFNSLYTRLQKLLFESVPAAKQPATRLKRQLEAAEIAIELWEKGHHFDEESGHVRIVPIPKPKAPPTPEQVALRKASIRATWRNGSRNS